MTKAVPPQVAIEDVGAYDGHTVKLSGWLYNARSKGHILFLQIRDGTGRIQAVAIDGETDPNSFTLATRLRLEASIVAIGTVREEPRAPSGYELHLHELIVVQAPKDEYPIANKSHGVDFLLAHRHLWLRSRRQEALMRLRSELRLAMHDFFNRRKFVLVDTPILTGAVGERLGHMRGNRTIAFGELRTGHFEKSDPISCHHRVSIIKVHFELTVGILVIGLINAPTQVVQ